MRDFVPSWSATILQNAPMIAPARQFTYPLPVPGEEDAMARGAMFLDVKPRSGGGFLALCALGFSTGSVAHGVHAMPEPDELCAIAGGYAYLIDTVNPEHVQQVPLRPVVRVLPVPACDVTVFAGFHNLFIRGRGDTQWTTPRLSWEGITLSHVDGETLYGTGWDVATDEEILFTLNLRTRACTGGGFRD
jgi:hypothetical protein